jgi:signal transduction histidine kinase
MCSDNGTTDEESNMNGIEPGTNVERLTSQDLKEVDRKVLVLEDNPDDADLLCRELEKAGPRFVCKVSKTREEFEEALRRFNPDIILCDYSLPSIDAVTAFRITQEIASHIPFIIVSGVIGEEAAVELIKDGVTDFVAKSKLFTLPIKIGRALKDAEDRKEKIINAQRLETQAAELMIANRKLQLFVHISSHDLQEPLRKLQIAASRIDEADCNAISANGKEQFKRMRDAAQSMQTLIEDILRYAGTTDADAGMADADLRTIVAEVVAEFAESIEAKQGLVDTAELSHAAVIPFHFRQVIRNLMSNSLKFADPQRPPHIVIKSTSLAVDETNSRGLIPGKEYCQLTVSDNGIGFEEAYNEKIFEVFQRLHGKEQYEGTGIGLAIVRKIVEGAHGIVTARGSIGNGARFDIYLPSH